MKNIKTSLAVVATLGSLLCFSAASQAEEIITDTVNGSANIIGSTWNWLTDPFVSYDNRGDYRDYRYVERPEVIVYKRDCDKVTHLQRNTKGKWTSYTTKSCDYLNR